MDGEMLNVALLAVLQGVTEILPISSSGHLVLGKTLLQVESPGVLLEAVLHGGSLLAILVYYRARLAALMNGVWRGAGGARRDAAAILVGCLPAAVCGLLFGSAVESAFASPRVTAAGLIATGLLLLVPRIVKPASRPGRVTVGQAAAVGLAQVAALLPGVSRSGTTITVGRLAGAEGREAASFSFLMAIPLLAGALGLSLVKAAGQAPSISPAALGLGFAVAAGVGYVAMALLNRLLASNRLWWFGPYCLAVGSAALLVVR